MWKYAAIVCIFHCPPNLPPTPPKKLNNNDAVTMAHTPQSYCQIINSFNSYAIPVNVKDNIRLLWILRNFCKNLCKVGKSLLTFVWNFFYESNVIRCFAMKFEIFIYINLRVCASVCLGVYSKYSPSIKVHNKVNIINCQSYLWLLF